MVSAMYLVVFMEEAAMDVRTDDRGKFFTPRVTKESVATAIRTTEHLIVGLVHVRPDQRLKDELNNANDRFIAITDARVHNAGGSELLFESSFLLVDANHVIFITPLEAIKGGEAYVWARGHEEPA
jgi:hypothetical protein